MDTSILSTMWFAVGGLVLFLGLGLATLANTDRWFKLGFESMLAGACIAAPVAIPNTVKLIAGSGIPENFNLLVSAVVPVLGVIMLAYSICKCFYGSQSAGEQ